MPGSTQRRSIRGGIVRISLAASFCERSNRARRSPRLNERVGGEQACLCVDTPWSRSSFLWDPCSSGGKVELERSARIGRGSPRLTFHR
jgi:hypothetical protein